MKYFSASDSVPAIVSCLGGMLVAGVVYGVGILMVPLKSHFGLSQVEVTSLANACTVIGQYGGTFLGGLLFLKFDEKFLFRTSMILQPLGYFMLYILYYYQFKVYPLIWLSFLCIGAGAAFTFVPSMACALTHTHDSIRSVTIGILMSFYGISSFFFPLIYRFVLASEPLRFFLMMMLCSVCVLVCCLRFAYRNLNAYSLCEIESPSFEKSDSRLSSPDRWATEQQKCFESPHAPNIASEEGFIFSQTPIGDPHLQHTMYNAVASPTVREGMLVDAREKNSMSPQDSACLPFTNAGVNEQRDEGNLFFHPQTSSFPLTSPSHVSSAPKIHVALHSSRSSSIPTPTLAGKQTGNILSDEDLDVECKMKHVMESEHKSNWSSFVSSMSRLPLSSPPYLLTVLVMACSSAFTLTIFGNLPFIIRSTFEVAVDSIAALSHFDDDVQQEAFKQKIRDESHFEESTVVGWAVALMSIGNGFGRVLMGTASDWSKNRYGVSRSFWCTLTSCFLLFLCGAILHVANASSVDALESDPVTIVWDVLFLCAMVGLIHGFLFTISATLVSEIVGVVSYPAMWGIVMLGPCMGGSLANRAYAAWFEYSVLKRESHEAFAWCLDGRLRCQLMPFLGLFMVLLVGGLGANLVVWWMLRQNQK
eukprot:GDKJ01015053.1.p1 GENE.GDKJ01015053.1~~GDKJ01015053.1.p1  ORF type:complete len:664 (-),score=81.83 GDKJ01015053.1:1126-3069(-)